MVEDEVARPLPVPEEGDEALSVLSRLEGSLPVALSRAGLEEEDLLGLYPDPQGHGEAPGLLCEVLEDLEGPLPLHGCPQVIAWR